MKYIYYLKYDNPDPLNKDFLTHTNKIKKKMIKDRFLDEVEDSIIFIPTENYSHVETIYIPAEG